MRAILGSPRKRGNSDSIEAAVYVGAVVAGVAVSEDSTSGEQMVVKSFAAADGFVGFTVANDLNKKTKTVSVIRTGLDVPIKKANGKTFSSGGPVFLNAAGEALPDATGAVYQVNGSVRQDDVTGLDSDGNQVNAITIDLFGGGAATA